MERKPRELINEAQLVAEFPPLEIDWSITPSAFPLRFHRHRPTGRWIVELTGFWEAYTTPDEVRTFADSILNVLADGSRPEASGPLGQDDPDHLLSDAEFTIGDLGEGPYLMMSLCDGTCGSPQLCADVTPDELATCARALLAALES